MFRSAPPVGQNETLCRTHSETYIKVLFSFLDSFLQRTALLNDILLRSNKNPVLYHYLWNQHGFYKKCFVLPHLPLDPFRLYCSIYEYSCTHAHCLLPATKTVRLTTPPNVNVTMDGSRKYILRMRTTVFIDTEIKSERVYRLIGLLVPCSTVLLNVLQQD